MNERQKHKYMYKFRSIWVDKLTKRECMYVCILLIWSRVGLNDD